LISIENYYFFFVILAISSVRGKFPSANPTAPVISSSNKSIDYSKLSSTDRLELEKRECQEREQELKYTKFIFYLKCFFFN
jgi:hypothetical protein